MANPFGFSGSNNPFITTVLFPAVAGQANNQTRSSPTYANPNNQPKQIAKANSGEWVPSDFDKVRALYDQRRGASSTFGNDLENQFLAEQAQAVAEGREPPPDIVDTTISGEQVTFQEIVELSQKTRFGNQTYLGSTLGQQDVDNLLQDASVTSLATLEQKLKARNKTAADRAKISGRFTDVDRLPFVLTCQKWIDESSVGSRPTLENIGDNTFNANTLQANINSTESERYIFCNVNPSSISWSFPIRAVDQLTMGGRVQHVWRSPKRHDSYFDEPVIRFTFQSGNIMPLKFVDSIDGNGKAVIGDSTPGLPAGLSNFYKFFELFNQPRIINDTQGNRAVNLVYIFYNSRAFPRMTLRGLWNPDGIQFEESAEDPNQITWTATFTAYDSYPAFGSPQQMVQTFRDAGFGATRVTDGA